jgi:hypothetical protein
MQARNVMRRFAGAALALTAASACSSNGGGKTAPADASTEAGVIYVNDDAGVILCSAALATGCENPYLPSGNCPPSLESALPGPWCATNPNAGAILGACAGYAVLPESSFADVELYFLYAADGGTLAAVIQAKGTPECVGGVPGFSIPTSCFPVTADNLGATFNGAGAAPGCSAFDAGSEDDDGGDAGAALDAGPLGDGGDAGDASAAESDAGDAGADADVLTDAGDAGN